MPFTDVETLFDLQVMSPDTSGKFMTYSYKELKLVNMLPVLEGEFKAGRSVWIRPTKTDKWLRADPQWPEAPMK